MTVTTSQDIVDGTRTAPEYVLTLQCPESPGLVHAVSGFLVEHGCDILENQQFDDWAGNRFYQRLRFAATSPSPPTAAELRQHFGPLADKHGMEWRLEPAGRRTRVLIMVSKFGHCLNDLLFRARTGELPVEVVAVVSNHPDHAGLVGWHGIPFFHVPVTRDTKAQAEDRLRELITRFDVELVVLARYMQILSDELTRELAGRCINIHHSFLPSFKGAKPYHQAYARGVKMVGATAHYVTGDLDEGPIIAQEVIPVDHAHTPDDLVAVGRNAEVAALTKAVHWHSDHRVLLDGHRTVVLR